jgi:hypothetical protein
LIPFIDSITEENLLKSLRELKANIAQLTNKNSQLSLFWPKDFERAPFEEELTLSQISTMDPTVFLKKKSVTIEKLQGLTQAIYSGIKLGRLTVVPSHKDLTKSKITKTTLELIFNDRKHLDQNLQILGLFSLTEIFSENNNFLNVLHDLLFYLGTTDFYDYFFKDKKISSSQKFEDIISSSTPEVWLHWSTAISGPGASSIHLFGHYLNDNEHPIQLKESFEKILIKLINLIGASEVKIKKKFLTNHFSKTPEVAATVLKAMTPKGGFKSKQEFLDATKNVFPLFDLEKVWGLINNSES